MYAIACRPSSASNALRRVNVGLDDAMSINLAKTWLFGFHFAESPLAIVVPSDIIIRYKYRGRYERLPTLG
jgi:hypothetical protein